LAAREIESRFQARGLRGSKDCGFSQDFSKENKEPPTQEMNEA
jgi:hypothetical protein